MGVNFAPINNLDGGLFGVRIAGTSSRDLKKRLSQLAEKCLTREKTNVVIDVTELDAIGGGAGAVLAEFQRDLLGHKGELKLVGVGDTDRRMLEQRFEELQLNIFATMDDIGQKSGLTVARAGNSSVSPSEEPPPATVETSDPDELDAEHFGAVAIAPDDDLEADKYLDDILFGFESSAGTSTEIEEFDEAPPAADEEAEEQDAADDAAESVADGETGGSGGPHDFMELDDALAAIRKADSSANLHIPLCSLLHAHDLAASVVFCVRRDDKLVDVDGGATLSLSGGLGEALAGVDRPLSLLDLPDDDLDEEQADFLAELESDLILPVVWNGELVATAFLKRGKDDPEYGVSESFALEMLMKQIWRSENDEPSTSRPAAEPKPAALVEDPIQAEPVHNVSADMNMDLINELRKAQIMFALNDELGRVTDERSFWEQFLAVLDNEVDFSTLVFLDAGANIIDRRYCLGEVEDELLEMDLATSQCQDFFRTVEQSVAVSDIPDLVAPLRTALEESGMTCVASLRDHKEWMGTLMMGIRGQSSQSVVDNDFLNTILQQTFRSLRSLRRHAGNDTRSLDLVRLVTAATEARQFGSARFSELLVHYTRVLLREVGFSEVQERDIVLGVLLRDLGLVEMDWATTLSPQSLDEKQWQVFRSHPENGARVLASLRLPPTTLEVVTCHHERFNGDGFPLGLSRREIPLSARLVGVVEHYVTMISDLPGSPVLSARQAAGVLRENVGEAFDPDIIDIFLRILELEEYSTNVEAADSAIDPVVELFA